MSVVQLGGKITCISRLKNSSRDRCANNMPIFLVKDGGHTVGSRNLG